MQWRNEMKEVSKEEFFKSFETAINCHTGCEHTHKVWTVKMNGYLRARAVQEDDGTEKYYIREES